QNRLRRAVPASGQGAPLFLQAVCLRRETRFESRRDEGRRRTRHEGPHPGASRTHWQIWALTSDFALTAERKAAILASDDWAASRTARRKKTESGARRRGRRGVRRASAAFDVRCAWRTSYRSDPPDPHPRA